MKITRYFIIYALLFINETFSCTIFTIKKENNTIIGKNRDALYSNKQSFSRIKPINQFTNWYNNNYNHNLQFYALIVDNDVKMGINESGLTAIEEDPLFPQNHKKYRRFIQPINGNSEGMILFGILQNFSSVNEIIPNLNIIFSNAAPNFYQIADKNKILVVEVAFGKDDFALTRDFTYKVIDKNNTSYTHTNNYLSSNFTQLNNISDKNSLTSSQYRLNNITKLVNNYNNKNELTQWFFNTKSNLNLNTPHYTCLNSSIFRSNIGNHNNIPTKTIDNKIYGSISNMIIINKANSTKIIVRILDSIQVRKNQQIIHYKELNTTLKNLFKTNNIKYIKKSFIRKLPKNNICE
jgi:hypothetical protein